MRHRRRLRKVAQPARKRLRRLRHLAETVDRADLAKAERTIAHVAIELLTLWSNFVRSYYVACALGARRGRHSRVRTSKPYASVNDAIGAAIAKFRPSAVPRSTGLWHRRDEPTWHDNQTLITLAKDAKWSNEEVVAAALSIKGVRGALDLPVFRNFYAHRNPETLKTASQLGPQYGIPQHRRLSEILLAVPKGGHEALLLQWIGEFDIIIEWLCEK